MPRRVGPPPAAMRHGFPSACRRRRECDVHRACTAHLSRRECWRSPYGVNAAVRRPCGRLVVRSLDKQGILNQIASQSHLFQEDAKPVVTPLLKDADVEGNSKFETQDGVVATVSEHNAQV